MYQKEGWLQRAARRMQRFMAGRYGQNDRLNKTLMWASLLVVVIGLFVPVGILSLCVTLVAYSMMGYAIFRIFSKNTHKRYRENRRFLNLLERIRDRKHRYYTCPKCKQSVRVPKGKGKIAIACPRCREKFVRKT